MDVLLILDSGEPVPRAVVHQPHQVPWSVVPLTSEGDDLRPVEWKATLFLPRDVEPRPVVCESFGAARSWVQGHGLAERFNWDCLNRPLDKDRVAKSKDTLEYTERYLEFARKHEMPANSVELFELARREGILHTLTCYPQENCTGNDTYAPPPGQTVELPWTAYSCISNGQSELWDASGEKVAVLRTSMACDPISVGAQYANTN